MKSTLEIESLGVGAWESQVWEPPPALSPDEWSEENIVLSTELSPVPGPLSWGFNPQFRQPLRDLADPEVEEITICCGTQQGKTLFLMSAALWTIVVRRYNAIHAMPRDEDAEEIAVERYQRIVLNSPNLARLWSGEKKDLKSDVVRLAGVTLTFTGAQSAAGLASKNAGMIAGDEVEKWPEWAGREASPTKLLEERTAQFPDRKKLWTSTPRFTHGYVWNSLEKSNRYRYWVPCARCGEFQDLVMGDGTGAGVRWPVKAASDEILDGSLAWYECARCGGRNTNEEIKAAQSEGIWVPRGCEVRNGKVRGEQPPRRRSGYHLWAIHSHSPNRTLHHIAAEFLESHRVPAKLMNFKNSWLAEPWQNVIHELAETVIESRRTDYRMGTVPDGAYWLTIGIDVQASGGQTFMFYVIRAWGLGEESWLVRAGRAESWDVIHGIIFSSEYMTDSGRRVDIVGAFIDSNFRTEEVYRFCLRTGITAIRGDTRIQAYYRRSSVEIDGETIDLCGLQVDYYKSMVHRMARTVEQDQDGKIVDIWHLPADVDREYLRHMAAEQLVQQRNAKTGRIEYVWQLVSSGAENHLFDCEVYATAAADIIGLRNRTSPYDSEDTDESEETVSKKGRGGLFT